MKKTSLVILSFVFAIIANAQITKVEIMATGLTCSMCSNAINKQLKTIDEVENVDIDLNKNLFIVRLKNNNTLSPKTFNDKVEKAGFFEMWRLLPHGIFELPAVFISLGLGIRLGTTLFNRNVKNIDKEIFRRLRNSFKVFIFIVLPLLVVAAIIEGVLMKII